MNTMNTILSLAERLKAGTNNPVKRTNWPGTDMEIGIKVLSEKDFSEAGLAADKLYFEANISVTTQNIQDYLVERDVQILYRAIVDPENPKKPLFAGITDFKALLTRGVREILVAEANTYQDLCSPNPYNMEEAEFDSLFLSVKKNYPQTTSSISNIFLARKLINALAKELLNSQQASGSI
jgi:hypothetical protein